MFYSTRNFNNKVSASKAIMCGLASDGGLFLPESFPLIKVDENLCKLSYNELASKILLSILDDFTKEEIDYCIKNAYNNDNFVDGIIGMKDFDNYSFLELTHGPTIAFKDMALTLLPYLMEISAKKQNINKKIMILSATSGDTGSAVLSGFSKQNNILINILYPNNGVSYIQEKQMLYFTSASSRAYALNNANFDDCQNFVKELLNKGNDDYILTSANSINIGRLVPQIVYYFASYIYLVNNKKIKLNDKVNFIVPTGNFGNILACYFAKKMGLPVNKFVCASNSNNVLTDMFNTGIYSLEREFVKTISPSMDILISSNFERLLSLYSDDDKELNSYMISLKENRKYKVSDKILNKLKEDFVAISIDENATLSAVKECYKNNNYLIDPHSAVAYQAYKECKLDGYSVVVSTANPLKFTETILKALEVENNISTFDGIDLICNMTKIKKPIQLEKILNSNNKPFNIDKSDYEKQIYGNKVITVKTPATSANLGPGFDVCGIALSLFNEFKFELSSEDKLIGFDIGNEKNLVMYSYKYLFERLNKNYQPVTITTISQDIPVSRGLGSSSSCIVAGLIGANYMLQNILSIDELFEIACEIEGHPDNVAPCIYGGLINTIKVDDSYKIYRNKVSNDLKFTLCIPPFAMKTSEARKVLPQSLEYKDIIYNTSRIVELFKGLEKGKIEDIKECIKDRIHTPYRISLIKGANVIEKFANDNNIAFTISGSGSTLLLISKESILEKLECLNLGFEFKELEVKDNLVEVIYG